MIRLGNELRAREKQTREAKNAQLKGSFDSATSPGEERVAELGGVLFKLSDKDEAALKSQNGLILKTFQHLSLPQPRWMTGEGVSPSATLMGIRVLPERDGRM